MKESDTERLPLLLKFSKKSKRADGSVVIEVRSAPVLCDDVLFEIGRHIESPRDLLSYRSVNRTLFFDPLLRQRWFELKIMEKAAEEGKEIDLEKLRCSDDLLAQYMNTLFPTKHFDALPDADQIEFTRRGREYIDPAALEVTYRQLFDENTRRCHDRIQDKCNSIMCLTFFISFFGLAALIDSSNFDRQTRGILEVALLIFVLPVQAVCVVMSIKMGEHLSPITESWANYTTARPLEYVQVRSGASIYEEELRQQQMQLLDRLAPSRIA